MSTLDQAMVRGEVVTILRPTPSDWSGLGSEHKMDSFLVEYPDGEVGSVPRSELKELKSNA